MASTEVAEVYGETPDEAILLDALNGDLNAASKVFDTVAGADLIQKEALVGKPFFITEVRFNKGEYAENFVSCVCLLGDGSVVVFNDGSTGIRAEILEYLSAKGLAAPANDGFPVKMALLVKRGLRASDYTYTDDKGKETPARTYYLG